MNEQLHRFGADARLCGILHMPGTVGAMRNRIATVFITAGLLHKPGPFRLYVELSRSLAVTGVPSLRFDLSGIGESGPRPGGDNAEHAAVADVQEAMDWLEAELGIRNFVLAGLCSGAEVAHRTAIRDARVVGMVAMDGYIVRTPAYYFWHYLPRVFSVHKWTDFLASKVHRLFRRAPGHDEPELDALSFWDGPGPDRKQLADEFNALCRRKVRQLQVFSGGSGDCSYAGQFLDAFSDVDFGDCLTVEFLPETDHVYILHADRVRLMKLITDWITEHFVVPAATRSRLAGKSAGFETDATLIPGITNASRSITLAGRRNIE